MNENKNDFLEEVFALLTGNLYFPYYQAERRIDIFINFFLEDIVQQNTKFKDAKYIAAEFPLKKTSKTDHAAHIDYLMYSKKYDRALLVELKTDNNSYKQDQIFFYLNSRTKFIEWYRDFESIKMKGFKPKKEYLINKIKSEIGINIEKIENEVIVIKPTHSINDIEELEMYRNKIHFIELKKINSLKTVFEKEWNVLYETILSKLNE